jgi:hypothetical protein
LTIDPYEPAEPSGIRHDQLPRGHADSAGAKPRGQPRFLGDAEALHREFLEEGATIRLLPTNYPWALEFHVEDPDRHILRFGSEPKADQPFSNWVAWYEEDSAPALTSRRTHSQHERN